MQAFFLLSISVWINSSIIVQLHFIFDWLLRLRQWFHMLCLMNIFSIWKNIQLIVCLFFSLPANQKREQLIQKDSFNTKQSVITVLKAYPLAIGNEQNRLAHTV